MYQPIPIFDYSFNMLPWRRRVRWMLNKLDAKLLHDPVVDIVNVRKLKEEIDQELDKVFWNSNANVAWRGMNARIAKYAVLSKEGDDPTTRSNNRVKLEMLKAAMDEAFAGVQQRFRVPQWKMYMLEVVKTGDNVRDSVSFTAESTLATDHTQAFDWVLQAVMDQEDEIMDTFKWSIYRLFKCPYNNLNKRIDITQEFWDYAGPLAENPMNLF